MSVNVRFTTIKVQRDGRNARESGERERLREAADALRLWRMIAEPMSFQLQISPRINQLFVLINLAVAIALALLSCCQYNCDGKIGWYHLIDLSK